MKRISATLALSLFIALSLLFTAGCNSNKAKLKAMSEATQVYADLRAEQKGDQAVVLSKRMVSILEAAGLSLKDIHVKATELETSVKDAYFRDAKAKLADLRHLRSKPTEANNLRREFYRTQELSGRSLANFRISAERIDRLVAINYLGAAKGQYARIGASDLRAANIKIPVTKVAAKKLHRNVTRNVTTKQLAKR